MASSRSTNTMGEFLSRILADVAQAMTLPDADLEFLTWMHATIVNKIREPIDMLQGQGMNTPLGGLPAGIQPGPGMGGGLPPGPPGQTPPGPPGAGSPIPGGMVPPMGPPLPSPGMPPGGPGVGGVPNSPQLPPVDELARMMG